MRREVGAQLQVEVFGPTVVECQLAVAPQSGAEVMKALSFTLNGNTIEPTELIGQHGTRIPKFDAGEGTVPASYSATIIGQAEPAPLTEIDLSTYLRPRPASSTVSPQRNSATSPSRSRCWRRFGPGLGHVCSTCPDPVIPSMVRPTPSSPETGVCRDYAPGDRPAAGGQRARTPRGGLRTGLLPMDRLGRRDAPLDSVEELVSLGWLSLTTPKLRLLTRHAVGRVKNRSVGGYGSRGSPSSRSAMMLSCTSEVPP